MAEAKFSPAYDRFRMLLTEAWQAAGLRQAGSCAI